MHFDVFDVLVARGMQFLLSKLGKRKTKVDTGKKCDWCETRENVKPVSSAGNMRLTSSAGKDTTGSKRGKTCNRCQERENIRFASGAGKYSTGGKRGKTCNRCQHSTRFKRGTETFIRCQARNNVQPAFPLMKAALPKTWEFLFLV